MELVSQIGGGVTNGLAYIGSLTTLGRQGGLFHFCGAVSGQAAAFAARCVAGYGSGRPGFTDSFPDYVFHWADSGAAGRLRAAKSSGLWIWWPPR